MKSLNLSLMHLVCDNPSCASLPVNNSAYPLKRPLKEASVYWTLWLGVLLVALLTVLDKVDSAVQNR